MSKDTVEIHRQALPYDVYITIFGYLSVKDICTAMTVCKVASLTGNEINSLYFIVT